MNTKEMLLDNWNVSVVRDNEDEANKMIEDRLVSNGLDELTDKAAIILSKGKASTKEEYISAVRDECEKEAKNKMFEILKTLTDMTKIEEFRTDNLGIFTIKGFSKDGESIEGWLHNRDGNKGSHMRISKLKETYGVSDEILDETVKKTMMTFHINGKVYFTTRKVLGTLAQRAGSGLGDFASRGEMAIRFYRNAGYIQYMIYVPCECKALYRESGNTKKVFATFSDRYMLVKQYPLVEFLVKMFEKEMGKSTITAYSISNVFTEIHLEFPEKGDDFSDVYHLKERVIPGIRILLSDVGESSIFINGTFRVNKHTLYMPGSEFHKTHTKTATEEYIQDAVSTKVFASFTKAPERLAELLTIDIKNPKAAISEVIEACNFQKNMGIGKRTITAMENELLSQVNSSLDYTAYDIVSMFLELQTTLESKAKTFDALTKIRNTFSTAIFFKYEDFADTPSFGAAV